MYCYKWSWLTDVELSIKSINSVSSNFFTSCSTCVSCCGIWVNNFGTGYVNGAIYLNHLCVVRKFSILNISFIRIIMKLTSFKHIVEFGNIHGMFWNMLLYVNISLVTTKQMFACLIRYMKKCHCFGILLITNSRFL